MTERVCIRDWRDGEALLELYGAGLSAAAIGELYGKNANAVNVRLSRERRRRGMAPIRGLASTAPMLTALNIETTRRYNACIEAGGHRPSRRHVLRALGQGRGEQALTVCSRCDVPYERGR